MKLPRKWAALVLPIVLSATGASAASSERVNALLQNCAADHPTRVCFPQDFPLKSEAFRRHFESYEAKVPAPSRSPLYEIEKNASKGLVRCQQRLADELIRETFGSGPAPLSWADSVVFTATVKEPALLINADATRMSSGIVLLLPRYDYCSERAQIAGDLAAASARFELLQRRYAFERAMLDPLSVFKVVEGKTVQRHLAEYRDQFPLDSNKIYIYDPVTRTIQQKVLPSSCHYTVFSDSASPDADSAVIHCADPEQAELFYAFYRNVPGALPSGGVSIPPTEGIAPVPPTDP